MSWLYLGYLTLALIGSLLLARVFGISFAGKKKAILFSLIPTAIVFILWDSWAVSQNVWEFGLEQMLGILIENQPVEEILFFLIIPFFGIVLWEIANKMDALRVERKMGEKKL
mgnify:CR=1 FL=1